MRAVIPLLLLVTGIGTHFCSAQSELLTNKTIVTMVNTGFSDQVIIEKIKSSRCNFNVGLDSLVWLKNQKVSDEIITVMMNTKSESQYMRNSDNPLDPHQSGIYYFNPTGETGRKLVVLDPNKISQQKSSTVYLYGVPVSSNKIAIDGEEARLQIKDPLPVFYFYFQTSQQSSLNNSGGANFTASSPNEFSIIVFDVNSHTHQRQVPTSGGVGSISSSGVSSKNKLQFDYERVGDGIYKVYAKEPMREDEYAFMYSAGVPENRRIFDFGIEEEQVKKSKRN